MNKRLVLTSVTHSYLKRMKFVKCIIVEIMINLSITTQGKYVYCVKIMGNAV